MSLTKKIVVLLLVVCGTAMSINGILESNRISSKLFKEAAVFHQTLLKNSAIGLGRSVFEVQEDLTEIMISSLFNTKSVQSVLVFNNDGSYFMGLVREQDAIRMLEEEELEKLSEANSNFEDDFSSFLNQKASLVLAELEEGKDSPQVIDPHKKLYRNVALLRNFEDGEAEHVGFMVMDYDKKYVYESVEDAQYRLILWSVILGIVLIVFIFSFLEYSIVAPIKKLKEGALKIASGNYEHTVKIKSRDEIGDLSISFDTMRQEVKNFTNNLQTLVEERTLELSRKSQDIRSMLQNMHQGIFVILVDRIVHKEYSNYLETILQTNEIAGKDVVDLLFVNSNLGKNDLNQIVAALDSCLEESEFGFIANEHLFPSEIIKEHPQGQQILELTWEAISEENIIKKIMVIIRDVTELRKLQADANIKNRQLDIISQIMASSVESFEMFASATQEQLNDARSLILKSSHNLESLDIIFRNVHTIKGNSRLYNFSFLVEVVHEAEEYFGALREVDSKNWDPRKMLPYLESVEVQFAEYFDIYENSIKGMLSGGNEKSELILRQCLNIVGDLEADKIENKQLAQVVLMIQNSDTFTLKEVLDPVIKSVSSVAKELGKPSPKVHIVDNGIRLKNHCRSLLNDVFMHCVRNSMDHGIELPENRIELGKSAHGNIFFKVRIVEKHFKIHIFDDGRGLNLEGLRKKGRKLNVSPENLDTDIKVAQLIFRSGLSTAETVTKISGRGVGMDAIKGFLQKNGGDIELNFTGQKDMHGFQPFEFIIDLPISVLGAKNGNIEQVA